MYISQYDLNGQGRNKIIRYGQYQKQGSERLNFNTDPPKPVEDEIELSSENKNLAEYLTKVTLKMFKIETDKKELSKDAKQINTGLDYFI